MASDDPSANIGRNIRQRRLELGLSLESLADTSGVSSTMLSEVERGRKNPTVKLAYQIALALGCSLNDLLEASASLRVSIVRAEQRSSLVDPSNGVVRRGLRSELVDRDLELAWYELPPEASTGELRPNMEGVLEQLVVLRGRVEVVLGGTPHRLSIGDSITYAPQTTMEYRNPTAEPCEILILIDNSRRRARVG
mgnify:CR=1 FL=1|jgi:transcriptional regulator with XRE-family HTH domain